MQSKPDALEILAPTTPFFTIGLTTYQRPNLLAKAIQSVLGQTFTDYELFIIDDASPDDMEKIVQQFDAPNIHYVRQQTNQGIGVTRNQVIDRAQGKFIIFLDDDDMFTPEFLSHVHQALCEAPSRIGFAIVGRRVIRIINGKEVLIGENTYGHTSTLIKTGTQFLNAPFSGGSGLVVRTIAARQVGGFNVDRSSLEDTDFMLQLALEWDFAIIPQAIFLVYSLPQLQITHNRVWIGGGLERLADEHAETLRRHPLTRTRFYRNGARMFYSAKQRESGRRCVWKALQLAPLSYKTWVLFVLLELNEILPLNLRRRLLSHYRHGYQPA